MIIYLRNLIWITSTIFLSHSVIADSFNYNSYNNHGVTGLINTPTARLLDEGSFGLTLFDGTPDQKITLTSSPFHWLEASFFYTNIQGRPYGSGFDQDYKDKGFNFKIKLKDEGILPSIAIGLNDLAGTGFYSSEYIVASYGISNIDIHAGLGWGKLNGSNNNFKNPLIYLHNGFGNRSTNIESEGGQFQPSRYFSGKDVSPFFGISYALNNSALIKIEYDPTLTSGPIQSTAETSIGFDEPNTRISIGIDYKINNKFTIGLSRERDDFFSLRFVYKDDGKKTLSKNKYKSVKKLDADNKFTHFIKDLESNGIGVNKVIETSEKIGLEITQFSHPNLDIIEEIIMLASSNSGLKKEIETDYRIANLEVKSYVSQQETNSKLIYQRKKQSSFSQSSRLVFRPFLASREDFFKGSLMFENNNELIIKDNFFFSSNLKYSIIDNFGDFIYEPVDVYPAQVRSDIKEYLKNFKNRLIIGRAQFDFHITPKKNNHIMLSAGILEEMFSGYGLEYLYFDNSKNYALGFEIFDVKKRDYNLRFGSLDYKNVTSHLNFYYRNYGFIPFDAKISYGEYLAGDKGATFELSRSYLNGAKFGVFASFTDVTPEQFGEGTFDKGIFFNIPIYKNFVNYTWRPLTKDPGAKLIRKHTLHDLLVKFQPHNP